MVEPTACAVHAARSVGDAGHRRRASASGTLGLLTIAALRRLRRRRPRSSPPPSTPSSARWAHALGADARRAPRASWPAPCASATGSLVDRRPAHRRRRRGRRLRRQRGLARPGAAGRRARRHGASSSACPATPPSTSPPLWHRETALRGCYAYDREPTSTTRLRARAPSSTSAGCVSATYPLARYADAIDHAANAGSPRRREDRLRPAGRSADDPAHLRAPPSSVLSSPNASSRRRGRHDRLPEVR